MGRTMEPGSRKPQADRRGWGLARSAALAAFSLCALLALSGMPGSSSGATDASAPAATGDAAAAAAAAPASKPADATAGQGAAAGSSDAKDTAAAASASGAAAAQSTSASASGDAPALASSSPFAAVQAQAAADTAATSADVSAAGLTPQDTTVVASGVFPSCSTATWTITSDGVLTFAGTGTVSESYSGDYQTSTTPWFPYQSSITSAVFTGSVSYTSLGFWFDNCRSLKSVSAPAGFGATTTATYNMFMYCKSLTSINLPSGFAQNAVEMTGMFDTCTSLTSLVLPSGFGQGVGANMSNMFWDCESLTSLTLPDYFASNANIVGFMFTDCYALKSVTLPVGFGSKATQVGLLFWVCTSLQSAAFPAGFGQNATSVGGLFNGCSSLTSIDFSKVSFPKATDIGDIFSSCGSFRQVKLGASWTFKGAGGSTTPCQLPDPPAPYSVWRAVGQGTVLAPAGPPYTAAELTTAYTATMADTYVWGPPLTGSVSVSGAYTPSSTLTAAATVDQADASLAYAWYEAADATSAGTQVQTGQTYTPTLSDLGKYVYASVTDTSGKYSGSVSSARSQVQSPLSGSVTVTGTATPGSTLTAAPSGLSAGAVAVYAWYGAPDATSAGTLLPGTSATYTVAASDLGTYLYAVVTDSSGKYSGSLPSNRLHAQSPLAGSLAVSGSPVPDSTLAAALTGLSAGATAAYAWYSAPDATSAGTLLPSTSATYTATVSDLGRYIYAAVTDSSGKYTGSVVSNRLRVQTPLVGTVSVSGSFKPTSVLTASFSAVPTGASLSYGWYRASDATSAGTLVKTAATYTASTSDLGKYVYAVATDTSGRYSGSVPSARSQVQSPLAGSVTVTGTATPGSTLTAAPSGLSTGAVASYMWYSASDQSSAGIALGTTATTYAVTTSDLGRYLYAVLTDSSGKYSGTLSSNRMQATAPLAGTVSVTGTPVPNSTLTAALTGLSAGATAAYAWYSAPDATSAGTLLPSTSATYTATVSELGRYIYAVVTDTSGKYTGSVASNRAKVLPALFGTVSLQDPVAVGVSTVAKVPDGPSGVTYSYAWYLAADATSAGTLASTAASYTPAAGDVGKYLYAVLADSAGAYGGTISSPHAKVGTMLAGPVVVTGTYGVGCTLTASDPSAQTGATLSYTWYEASDATSAGTQVSTAASYTPVLADFGKYLYVTAVDSSGAYVGTLSSAHTMVLITGTFPSDAAASWTITPDGAITFAGTGTVTDQYTYSASGADTPWYPYRDLITSAVFTGSVSYTYLDCWLRGCRSLASVTMPAGFGGSALSLYYMFSDCMNLTSLTLPAGFGQNATDARGVFSTCQSLMSLTLPDGFDGNATLMDDTFINCQSLTSLTLPAGFGQNATSVLGTFINCSSLTSLTVPEKFGQNATKAYQAFALCSSLTSFTVPAGFGQNATDESMLFYNCSSLASLDLSGASAAKATDMVDAFTGCSALKQVKLGANWSFKGAGSTVLCQLPDPASPFSLWRAVGAGTASAPAGAFCTAADLAASYTGSMADTYVWGSALAGAVSVSGTYTPGATLTAAPSAGVQADAVLAYAWYKAADATSAGTLVKTGSAYTVAASDVGSYLYAVATDTSSTYAGTITSEHARVLAALAGSVSVTGGSLPGSVLTAAPSSDVQADAVLAYAWYSAPDAMSSGTALGVTAKTYIAAASDLGRYIYAVVTDSSGVYAGSLSSNRICIQSPLAGPVVVGGTPAMVGSALSASDPSAQTDAVLSWAWYVAADATSDGTLAGGGASYAPVAADYGKYVYATAADTSGKYSGMLSSARYQVGAVLSVTVPTSMPLVAAGSGAVTGAQAQASNASPVPVHVSSLSAVAASPFSLAASSSFDAASGQNLLSLLLAPGGGSAVDLAAYQTAAQPPAGQWNMAAAGGALSLTPSGRLKNATAVLSSTPVHAVDLSWSFAAGSL